MTSQFVAMKMPRLKRTPRTKPRTLAFSLKTARVRSSSSESCGGVFFADSGTLEVSFFSVALIELTFDGLFCSGWYTWLRRTQSREHILLHWSSFGANFLVKLLVGIHLPNVIVRALDVLNGQHRS